MRYFFIKIFIGAFRFIPFTLLYWLSDAMTFLLYYIIKYRKQVIISNLKNSFPEKTAKEINTICYRFYRNLSDVILEVLKGFTLSPQQLASRYSIQNEALLAQYKEKEQSVLLLSTHYANWEWSAQVINDLVPLQCIGVYKPLKNKYIEKIVLDIRGRNEMPLYAMQFISRAIVKHRQETCMYIFIADQTPVNVQHGVWIDFLNQDTPFYNGVEKLAKKTGYPVLFGGIRRIKRGHYQLYFEELCTNPKDTTDGQITTKYARYLEQIITNKPEDWLWSHRRWKRKRIIET